MTEKPIKPALIETPVTTQGQGMSPELAEILQSYREAIEDLRARLAALEP